MESILVEGFNWRQSYGDDVLMCSETIENAGNSHYSSKHQANTSHVNPVHKNSHPHSQISGGIWVTIQAGEFFINMSYIYNY